MNLLGLTASICVFFAIIIKLFPPTDLWDNHLSSSVIVTLDTPAKQRSTTCLGKQMTGYAQQSTVQPRLPRSDITILFLVGQVADTSRFRDLYSSPVYENY